MPPFLLNPSTIPAASNQLPVIHGFFFGTLNFFINRLFLCCISSMNKRTKYYCYVLLHLYFAIICLFWEAHVFSWVLSASLLIPSFPILIWGSIRKNIAHRSRELILPLCLALGRHIWSAGSSVGIPSTRKTWTCWSESSKGQKDDEGTGSFLTWGQTDRAGTVQPGEYKTQRDLIHVVNIRRERVKGMEPGSSWCPMTGQEAMDTV